MIFEKMEKEAQQQQKIEAPEVYAVAANVDSEYPAHATSSSDSTGHWDMDYFDYRRLSELLKQRNQKLGKACVVMDADVEADINVGVDLNEAFLVELHKLTVLLKSRLQSIQGKIFELKNQLNNINVWFDSNFPDLLQPVHDLYRDVRRLSSENQDLSEFSQRNLKLVKRFRRKLQKARHPISLEEESNVKLLMENLVETEGSIRSADKDIQRLSGDTRVLHCRLTEKRQVGKLSGRKLRLNSDSFDDDYGIETIQEVKHSLDLDDKDMYEFGKEPEYLDSHSKMKFLKGNDIPVDDSVASDVEFGIGSGFDEFLASQLFVRKSIHLRLSDYLTNKPQKLSIESINKEKEREDMSSVLARKKNVLGNVKTVKIVEDEGALQTRRDLKFDRNSNVAHFFLFNICAALYPVTIFAMQPLSLVYPTVTHVPLSFVTFCIGCSHASGVFSIWILGQHTIQSVSFRLRYTLATISVLVCIGSLLYALPFAVEIHADGKGGYLSHNFGDRQILTGEFCLFLGSVLLGTGSAATSVIPGYLCVDPDILISKMHEVVATASVLLSAVGEVLGVSLVTLLASSAIEINVKFPLSRVEAYVNELNIVLILLSIVWIVIAIFAFRKRQTSIWRLMETKKNANRVQQHLNNIRYVSIRQLENSYYEGALFSKQQYQWTLLITLQVFLRFILQSCALALPLLLQTYMSATYVETMLAYMLHVCMGVLALLLSANVYTNSPISAVTAIKAVTVFTLVLAVFIQQSYERRKDGEDMGTYLFVSCISVLSLCTRFTEYMVTAFLCNSVEWPPFAMSTYGTLSPVLVLQSAKHFGSFLSTCVFYYWLTN